MKILYIGYWGLNDSLTKATILPHLKVLSGIESIESIVFTSIERAPKNQPLKVEIDKVAHEPLFSVNLGFNLLNKIGDFILFRKRLRKIAEEADVDFILCRSSMAGALGLRLSRDLNIPFAVESFEPHAEYMIDSGVWTKWDLRYIFQKKWEEHQKKNAILLMPVSNNYKDQLIAEGIPSEKLKVMPCAVDLEKFRFSEPIREKTRRELVIAASSIAGIYVGKFGDIYLKEEAFQLFKNAFDAFGKDFVLIILSPQPKDFVNGYIEKYGLPKERCHVLSVSHEEVPGYLSAADFAFSTIRPSPSRKYCSPIKNGEYWANGLPILVPEGIGDDSEIVAEAQTGFVLDKDLTNAKDGFDWLKKELQLKSRQDFVSEIVVLAENHRSFEIVSRIYNTIFA